MLGCIVPSYIPIDVFPNTRGSCVWLDMDLDAYREVTVLHPGKYPRVPKRLVDLGSLTFCVVTSRLQLHSRNRLFAFCAISLLLISPLFLPILSVQ